MKLSVELECRYSVQQYLLAVDDVLYVTFASKQNNLLTAERPVWLILSELSWTILHVNNYSNNRAVKWHCGINRPINCIAEHFMQQFLANVNSYSRSLYAVARPTVCRLSSVMFVFHTQPVEIFSNVFTPFGTLAIRWPPGKILRGTTPAGEGVKRKRNCWYRRI